MGSLKHTIQQDWDCKFGNDAVKLLCTRATLGVVTIGPAAIVTSLQANVFWASNYEIRKLFEIIVQNSVYYTKILYTQYMMLCLVFPLKRLCHQFSNS